MRNWFFIMMVLISQGLSAMKVNVYLKYDDGLLKEKIHHFNQFLASHGVFKKYDIKPFIDYFPLHTTLYLTDYEPSSTQQVIHAVKNVSSHWSKLSTKTKQIYVAGTYVMLDVGLVKQANGLNHVMQHYADELTMVLVPLRDTKSPIPDWAQSIPSKRAAFERYGSPNVFFEFAPHFTLMAKRLDANTAKLFQQEINALIAQYDAANPMPDLTVEANQVGVGLVNDYGQVTEELASFDL